MAKKKKILRGMPGSTEPQARQVLNQIKRKKATPTKQRDTGGKTTAKSPFKAKTPAQTAKSLKEARKRAASRPTVKKKAQPKAKKRSYGRKMT